MADGDRYGQLIELLDRGSARYRLIDHPAEGRTDIVSPLRGHPVAQAAKCMVVMVKIGKKTSEFVLAVVPGDARVDLHAVKGLKQGTYAGFASPERAEELAASAVGTVLPFSFDPRLELIADPSIREHDVLYFNAARLDRSVALATDDYIRLANPRFARIAQSTVESVGRRAEG
jgi:Ala-tRNA(Pro) deacylase